MDKKKILVVDDDPFLCKVIGAALTENGYDVDIADNGRMALELIDQKTYLLVLLDMIMPVMNGFEVLHELKKLDYEVPVLVFTNLSQDSDKSEVLSLGAKDFFIKSNIPLEKVVSVVNRYAGKP